MKRNYKRTILAFLLVIGMIFSLSSCVVVKESEDVWSSAKFTADSTVGNGSKTITVLVKAEEKSVTFTLHTDKENLADALLEHDLIQGEQGPYGLYVKSVNGMVADYAINQSFWSLSQNGETMQTGISGVQIADGEQYELIYTK